MPDKQNILIYTKSMNAYSQATKRFCNIQPSSFPFSSVKFFIGDNERTLAVKTIKSQPSRNRPTTGFSLHFLPLREWPTGGQLHCCTSIALQFEAAS